MGAEICNFRASSLSLEEELEDFDLAAGAWVRRDTCPWGIFGGRSSS